MLHGLLRWPEINPFLWFFLWQTCFSSPSWWPTEYLWADNRSWTYGISGDILQCSSSLGVFWWFAALMAKTRNFGELNSFNCSSCKILFLRSRRNIVVDKAANFCLSCWLRTDIYSTETNFCLRVLKRRYYLWCKLQQSLSMTYCLWLL